MKKEELKKISLTIEEGLNNLLEEYKNPIKHEWEKNNKS